MERPEFRVKRAILGYERGEANGRAHIQGYVEFVRSVRLGSVRKVLDHAHWEAARGTASQNFDYCTKSGRYDVIGDFTREMVGDNRGNAPGYQPASVPQVISGLLDPMISPQVCVSKEYSDRHAFYDKAVNIVANIQIRNELFDGWKTKNLRTWQYEILKLALSQDDRKVLWVVDTEGNCGKSFLARYLSILYGFQMLDGIVSTRDLGPMLDRNMRGMVFDVCRANERRFEYGTLEAIKNGFICSGKYTGQSIWLRPVPVIIFANYSPDQSYLSKDRWQIVHIGSGIGQLDTSSTDAVVQPSVRFPLVRPPPVPDLRDRFDLRGFLEAYSEEMIVHNGTYYIFIHILLNNFYSDKS